jgi:hypothetical protein
MERLIVSLASLSFAALLLFEGKKDQPVLVSSPAVPRRLPPQGEPDPCAAVSGFPMGNRLGGGDPGPSPLLVSLTLSFVKGKTFLSRREVLLFAGVSLFLLLLFLGSVFPGPFFPSCAWEPWDSPRSFP